MKLDITPKMIRAGIPFQCRYYIQLVPIVDHSGPSKIIIKCIVENNNKIAEYDIGVFSQTDRLKLSGVDGVFAEMVKDAIYELIQSRAATSRDKTTLYKNQ
jgi:hypothetical protein